MRSFLRLTDFSKESLMEIFDIADALKRGEFAGFLEGKTVVLFFPDTSIRTRIAFEKGIYLLKGQTVLFPPNALDKREETADVAGYLNNWADAVVARHPSLALLEEMAGCSQVPVINAMTDSNHPCEVLADLYTLSEIRRDFLADRYLFCGAWGNIGYAWREAAEAFGLSFSQCCPEGYEMEGVECSFSLKEAVKGKDIICTDSFPPESIEAFRGFQVTEELMSLANPEAVLNPCPPFYRGEEVSSGVIGSKAFVGYAFKKYLLEIQQAVLIYCLTH